MNKYIAPAEAGSGWLLVELIELLQKIDVHGKLAKLNATTISDHNRRRIKL